MFAGPFNVAFAMDVAGVVIFVVRLVGGCGGVGSFLVVFHVRVVSASSSY